MFRIAIYDDDSRELSNISTFLKEYQKQRASTLSFDVFQSAKDLLKSIRNHTYDILLLNVLMPEIHGMQTINIIQNNNPKVKIIFLTSSPEHAIENYIVNAYYYLLKPISQLKLFAILDRLYLEATHAVTLSVKSSSGIIEIYYNKLEFLEVMNKNLYFHLTDGNVHEVQGALSDYENLLLVREEFVKIHRSYIVNMGWIKEIVPDMLTTCSGRNLPISRLLYPQVRERYMNHLFLEKGVE